MLSIIKAQLFGLKKERLLIISFFLLLAYELFQLYVYIQAAVWEDLEISLSAGGFAADYITMSHTAALYAVIIITGIVCCSDFNDKTANFEVMMGHTRGEVFGGRVITAVIMSSAAYFLLMNIPVAAASAILGWGGKGSFGEIALRLIMLMFPVIRYCCEMCFLAFLVRRKFPVILGGIVLYMTANSVPVILESTSPALSVTAMNGLTLINVWCSYGLEGNMNYVYDTAIDTEYLVRVVLWSAGVSAVMLFLGYTFFRYDDIE